MSRDFTPPDLGDLGRDLPESNARSVGRQSQDQDRDADEQTPPALPERSPERGVEELRPDLHFRDGRTVLYDRDHGYRLGESEIRTIIELGKFRVVATHDLSEHTCGGQRELADRDVQNLVRQGL